MPGTMVTFPSNGHTCEGYLAMPAGGSGPAIVVIQEWWGLVPWIKEMADRLAGEGFVALAPDLYHGQTADEPDDAGKIMMSMKMDEAARDMSGAFDYLKQHDATTGSPAAIGFCLGGGLALYVSTLRPASATVVYYGVLPGVQPDLSQLAGPVLGHYAEDDGWASPEAARALEQEIKDAGKQVEFHIYPQAKHAFMNPSPEVLKAGGEYNEVAARTSWQRTLDFLKEHAS